MKITLKNNFHNTETVVIASALFHGMHYEISLTQGQMDRASKKLCGVSGCTCGGVAGIRGRQELFGKKLIVNEFPVSK